MSRKTLSFNAGPYNLNTFNAPGTSALRGNSRVTLVAKMTKFDTNVY